MDQPLHRHRSEITFQDTDASGWAHFTAVLRHLEAAEHACLRHCGLLVFDRDQGGWPRVNIHCDYHRPLLCGDPIEVHLAVDTLGKSSVRWRFEVIGPHGAPSASGTLTTVRVNSRGETQAISPGERTALGCASSQPA